MGALAVAALAAFVLCALYATLGMNRYVIAALAAATTATTIGCALAFLRVLGVAWDDAPDAVTTVSSRDADPYFYAAVIALIATLGLLLIGAVWPARRRVAARSARRPSSREASRPAASNPRASNPRASSARTAGARTRAGTSTEGTRASEGRLSSPRTNPPKAAAPRANASGPRASGSRPSAPRSR